MANQTAQREVSVLAIVCPFCETEHKREIDLGSFFWDLLCAHDGKHICSNCKGEHEIIRSILVSKSKISGNNTIVEVDQNGATKKEVSSL